LRKAKGGYISGQDVVDIVSSPELQELLGAKGGGKVTSLSLWTALWTAQHWLKKLKWRYGQPKKGMYIDGHEREDVVSDRVEFLMWWWEYQK